MQKYYRYIFVLVLLHKSLAEDDRDQLTDTNTKNAVEELLKKIDEVSVQSFSNAPHSDKLDMLRKVEEKLKIEAKSFGEKGERYVKLIMEGIKAKALHRIIHNETKAESLSDFEYLKKSNNLNDTHKNDISLDPYGGLETNENLNRVPDNLDLNIRNEINNEDIQQNLDVALAQHLRRMDGESTVQQTHSITVNRETSSERISKNLPLNYQCEGSMDKICLNIKEMKELKCHFDDSVVPIEKLCNEFTDCIDRTDEKYCASQVTERIQNANKVIHQIDEYFKLDCFPNKTHDAVMTTQIIILRSVLQAQEEFVQKYKHFNLSIISNSESLNSEGSVKRAANEISLIISALALALDGELCSPRVKVTEELIARKFNDLLIDDFDKVMEEVEWPPKSCVCKEEHCANITTCTNTCKRICWQKHSLTRWSCPSINDTETVSIDVICDGKFDCFDQSDEKHCVTGKSFAKFAAHNIFKDILTLLSLKATFKEYGFIRNMLLSLHSNIGDLQKFCMAPEPDIKIIRGLRKKIFSALSSIYSETVTKASFIYQKSDVYVFLLSLNEKLINALKHSHTGNKRILSNDGCFCSNGRCAMPLCSRNCLRSCLAEPWLTRYVCEDTLNKSISLEDVCNHKQNCPKEDDEANCEKEICRRHHLTVLRHDIQKIGKNKEGTAMGELLSSWKIKVSSTLLVAESSYRPTSKTIRDVIRDILNDLVITYGAVKDYRRDNEYALQEFINIARNIIKHLKTCGH